MHARTHTHTHTHTHHTHTHNTHTHTCIHTHTHTHTHTRTHTHTHTHTHVFVFICKFRMSLFVSNSLLQYTFPHIKTPLFVLNSPYDTWQLFNVLQLNCKSVDNCPEAEKEAFFNYRNVSYLKQATPVLRHPEIAVVKSTSNLSAFLDPAS